jgi:hypothetical protein
MTGILAAWKFIAIALVVGLVAGFGAGWKVKSWNQAAIEQAHQANVRVDTVENMKDAQVADAAIGAATDSIERSTGDNAKEIEHALQQGARPRKPASKPRVAVPVYAAAPTLAPEPVGPPAPVLATVEGPADSRCDDPVLRVGVVGLLNRQLDPAAPDPAGWSDEEKLAASGVGLRELSLKLNEVAGEYHELAIRHDTLVVWVENEVRKSQEAFAD